MVEGADGVGRSTHIALLKEWFENSGHAVLDTGTARSALAGKGLKAATEGNTLGPIAMSLFYATDDDMYDSFLEYQGRLLRIFDAMSSAYGFHVVETTAPIQDVCDELKNHLEPLFASGVSA